MAWTGRDSGWLVAAGAAFTAVELLFVSARMGLSWDEVVYVRQLNGHAPTAWFDPARARSGVGVDNRHRLPNSMKSPSISSAL